MKYFLAICIYVLSFSAQAHCPYAANINSVDYCFDYDWLAADKKTNGAYSESSEMSPYLNKKGSSPTKWLYSKATIRMWKKGDAKHAPVFLQDFIVFPYMIMAGGHHHGAASQFEYDNSAGVYILSGMSLQQMEGCWSLRWGVATDAAKAELISNIEAYTNLTVDENKNLATFCVQDPAAETGPHEHHH